jgi:hypothetical protein
MRIGLRFCRQIIRILPHCLLCIHLCLLCLLFMCALLLLVIDYGQDYCCPRFVAIWSQQQLFLGYFYEYICLHPIETIILPQLYFSPTSCCICLTLKIVFLSVTVLLNIVFLCVTMSYLSCILPCISWLFLQYFSHIFLSFFLVFLNLNFINFVVVE